MPTLTNRASFWASAGVVAVALWASGAPSMIYPVYVAEWHLTPVVITSIFAVYPISLVIVLIVFGGISDFIGRRAVLVAGVSAMAIGILLFALAPNVGWLYAGRVLQGVGVGLAMSPASAAMVEFNAKGTSARASSINTAATAVGLVLATVVGGALVQYAPLPSHLSYWVLFVLTIALLVVVSFMPRRLPGTVAEGRWRPRGLVVPRGLGLVVFTAALSLSAGFAMGALMLSLGSQIAKDLIHTDNAFIAGGVIALSAVAIGTLAIVGRRLAPRSAIIVGGLATAVGMVLILGSAVSSSLPLFLVASLVAGSGYGLLFLGGLGLVNRFAPAHHRAQTISVVYLVAYLSQGLIAVAIGLSATATGLAPAVELWTAVIAAVCLLASPLALVTASRERRAAALAA
ncbi:MAG: hypothetical protein JWO10_320 [Microbacteriaceae bacterium]|nr:hypothetical protein [Microbacteriaceae bacterium]